MKLGRSHITGWDVALVLLCAIWPAMHGAFWAIPVTAAAASAACAAWRLVATSRTELVVTDALADDETHDPPTPGKESTVTTYDEHIAAAAALLDAVSSHDKWSWYQTYQSGWEPGLSNRPERAEVIARAHAHATLAAALKGGAAHGDGGKADG